MGIEEAEKGEKATERLGRKCGFYRKWKGRNLGRGVDSSTAYSTSKNKSIIFYSNNGERYIIPPSSSSLPTSSAVQASSTPVEPD